MMIWTRLKSLWPASHLQQEREVREELESLTAIAGSKKLGNLMLAMENVRTTWGWTWLVVSLPTSATRSVPCAASPPLSRGPCCHSLSP
jgi:hypothetical protein